MFEATTPHRFGATTSKDALTEVLQAGARQLLAAALEVEVTKYIDELRHVVDEHGRRLVVRNGYAVEREVHTGIGPVAVRQPRVNDRRAAESGERLRFTSNILPPYLRRTKTIDELIPWLYLKGISTGDFSEALAALVGPDAPGLSPT
ncbi:MAG: transposase, partial [Planctomycetes bacterium]|nr:transposase [Planctomycetota bacterium]